MYNNPITISSILYKEEMSYPNLTATKEVRSKFNMGEGLGNLSYTLSYNNNDHFRKELMDAIKSNNISEFLNIDARFLTDDVIDILNQSENLNTIRIVNDGYKVSNELCDKLNDNIKIIADGVEENLTDEYRNRTTIQHGYYKRMYGIDGNEKQIQSFFLTHEPTEEELDDLISEVNASQETMKTKIEFRQHNPKIYKKVIRRLQEKGLKSDVTLSFLGNPLYDDLTLFKDMSKISNPVEITYSTCNDIVHNFENEPFETNNFYHSELEGSGKTTVESYQNLLQVLDTQSKHIQEKGYSPLEATIYIYRYLQKNYAYDPDYTTTDQINTYLNRQLDIVAGKNTLVCEGYATLFSALMRKSNIPLFRYSTREHCRNIGRIKDDKYGIDKIAVFDPTNDGSSIDEKGNFRENNSFEFFMLTPEEIASFDDFITLPTSLVLDYDAMYQEGRDIPPYLSRDIYEKCISSNYIADGYTVRMLELMGFRPGNGTEKTYDFDSFREFLRNFNNTSIFDAIDPAIIARAYKTVMRKENEPIEERIREGERVELEIMERQQEFQSFPKNVIINNGEDPGENPEIIEDVFYPHCHTREISEFEKLEETKQPRPENDTTYHLIKDQIIQDLPISSNESSRYNGRMTDEEIKQSRIKLGFISSDINPDTTYRLVKDEIIQDLPINSNEPSRYNGRMTDEEILASQIKLGLIPSQETTKEKVKTR